MGSCFSDPVKAKEGKPGVVEFFWLVRRSGKEEDCNMALSSSSVVMAAGTTLGQESLKTSSVGKFVFPVMVSTKAIGADEELVCFHQTVEEPAIKKARINRS